MDHFLQLLLNAAILGGAYALIGVGLTLIYGIMRVVNFTHGELYTFGAYVSFAFSALLGVNFYISLVLGIVFGIGLGALIEFTLLRRIRKADPDSVMLVMIGTWMILQNLELLTWGPISKSINSPLPTGPIVLGPVATSWLGLFVFAAASVAILGVHTLI